MTYDVIIIGSGPAGLSAGVYLGRAKVKILLIGKPENSQVQKAHMIMNYLGFPEGIAGPDFLKKALNHVKKYKVPVIKKEVVNVIKKNNLFNIKTAQGDIYKSKAIIIATGTPIKLSGIQNEEKLTGKGVHYCVDCDGAMYIKKKIAIIGNGNHAAEDALNMLLYTKDVTVISNGNKFNFSPELKAEITKKKIKLLSTTLKSFIGEKKFEYAITMDNKKLKFDAIFMACGVFSALDFASKLAITSKNNILQVDQNCMTSEPGVFAAGNCISRCRQIAKSVGDGCNAGLSAIKFVRNKEVYTDYST